MGPIDRLSWFNDSGGNHRTHGFEFAISPRCGSGENVGVLVIVAVVGMSGVISIQRQSEQLLLGGGFKYFLFSSLLGEDSHFD